MNWSPSPGELTTDELASCSPCARRGVRGGADLPLPGSGRADRRDGVLHLLGYEEGSWRPMPVSWPRHRRRAGRRHRPGGHFTSVARGGLGHRLLDEAVTACTVRWPAHSICLGAQAHLQGFYGQHGFVAEGEGYLEDDILTWACADSLPDQPHGRGSGRP